ncbi:MAG: DNA methyltransferase [Gammaproteobacteria bacterium]|nr:DNA methyltransferase [Gammaproteobacteria bacterium]MXW46189.1 DNA methyltransferase [Gammaproteobacteria bacterium]MYD02095.1 DNA methyltransferase [Gammaproteobacteria bacterium]MYI24082.1 DNA methyltransferase [Gammaproteobacteria bacterium]
MKVETAQKLRQRADYTHKFNANTGRHGWLRLTPAYSVKIVEELMDRYDQPQRVLDPFCGTATTALSAAYRGHEGVTIDINPFLVWLGKAKTAHYSDATIASTHRICMRVMDAVRRDAIEPVETPRIHNINRWWPRESLNFLRKLRAGIEAESEHQSPERDLLLVGFCRTLIGASNAAFNHQSMSFKQDGQLHIPLNADMEAMFINDMRFVLDGAEDNPKKTGKVLLGDARMLSEVVDGPFDLVITSPPYANRMSYIRELRPYMYWLGFLDNGRDAGELDWSAIGGTWGIATSRLNDWKQPKDDFTHPLLDAPLSKIAHSENKNGRILANYVAKYFSDIWEHINSLLPILGKDSELHYIVGNSTFYGVLLSAEKIYEAMLRRLGFEGIRCCAIRKRNSKKELFEFDVSARWPN